MSKFINNWKLPNNDPLILKKCFKRDSISKIKYRKPFLIPPLEIWPFLKNGIGTINSPPLWNFGFKKFFIAYFIQIYSIINSPPTKFDHFLKMTSELIIPPHEKSRIFIHGGGIKKGFYGISFLYTNSIIFIRIIT